MSDSKLIHNSHNISDIGFHFICLTKYRRVVIDETVDEHLKQICVGIEARYAWISFLEIGTDKDHVHFLIQTTPNYSASKVLTTIKSTMEACYQYIKGNSKYYFLYCFEVLIIHIYKLLIMLEMLIN